MAEGGHGVDDEYEYEGPGGGGHQAEDAAEDEGEAAGEETEGLDTVEPARAAGVVSAVTEAVLDAAQKDQKGEEEESKTDVE